VDDGENKDWNRLYQDALLEVDGSKLEDKIVLASTAIEARLRELAKARDESRERDVLIDALQILQTLRREIP
jgi:hypothetical protein